MSCPSPRLAVTRHTATQGPAGPSFGPEPPPLLKVVECKLSRVMEWGLLFQLPARVTLTNVPLRQLWRAMRLALRWQGPRLVLDRYRTTMQRVKVAAQTGGTMIVGSGALCCVRRLLTLLPFLTPVPFRHVMLPPALFTLKDTRHTRRIWRQRAEGLTARQSDKVRVLYFLEATGCCFAKPLRKLCTAVLPPYRQCFVLLDWLQEVSGDGSSLPRTCGTMTLP
jgi:hypothetical protein